MFELAPIPNSEIASNESSLLEKTDLRSPIVSLKFCSPVSSLGIEMAIIIARAAEKTPPSKRLSLQPNIEPRIAQPAKQMTLPKLNERLFQPIAVPSDPLLK